MHHSPNDSSVGGDTHSFVIRLMKEALQSFENALDDGAAGFSSRVRNVRVGRLTGPPTNHHLLTETPLNLVFRQSLRLSEMSLTKSLAGENGNPQRVCRDSSRFIGPGKIAAENRLRPVPFEIGDQRSCLQTACRIDRNVGMPLKSALLVPIGFAMSKNQDLFFHDQIGGPSLAPSFVSRKPPVFVFPPFSRPLFALS